MQYLETLTWQGVRERFPEGISGKLFDQIHHELRLIEQLEYPAYFLTVYDIVRFARARGILCQGRGAAANSAVCFFLGVTAVDPTRVEMLFERFVSRERCEPPDIDIDFEHERREDVIQYIYQKYGRERAGLTAEVITYRGRSAVRDVGKALGLSLDAVDRLAKRLDHWDSGLFNEEGASAALRALGFDANDRMMGHVMALTTEILGFPRHRSQHVGGFVITRGALCELVPIENAAMPDRTVIEWDKDDIEAMGMLKVDVLGLGMLTCIRKSLELIDQHHGRALTLATIPAEESEVYDMICRADTVGVFQIESRAQMTMLPRLKPRNYYDLVIEVAIVRPGPIVGDMVHPFLRRRNGDEPVTYPTPEVERVLGRTLGIALFQEQAMALAIVAAGFTPGEAEMLRRTISAWKTRGKDAIPRYRSRFLRGMIDNGYDEKFALQCFERLKGFSEYGFPESHAASFALLVYSSAWIKQRYPAVFAAALLNSQPLGFYAPAQIVRDAQDHGVCVRPADVNHSVWDCTLEESGAVLRLGLRLIGGLRRADADRITDSLARFGESRSPLELWRRSGVSTAVLRILARADAFGSMGLTRQQALWSIQKIHDESLPLFDPNAGREVDSAEVELPILSPLSQVVGDYRATGLSLKAHPVSFLREQLEKKKVATAGEVRDAECFPHGRYAAVAGLVLFRQRPSTARGVVFMTLEDETGRADLIVRPHVYARFRATARYARLIIARGRVERNGLVVHVLVTRLTEIDETSIAVPTKSRDFR
ncbi:MAG: error-prone DNA polymerase [Phycisphaerales bacterium]|nr:error-prone DNA polymerase [Phycisphaerales bacterium]